MIFTLFWYMYDVSGPVHSTDYSVSDAESELFSIKFGTAVRLKDKSSARGTTEISGHSRKLPNSGGLAGTTSAFYL